MKRIVIVGLGRSGTSFITEFLSKCGVFLDEVNWAYEHELARLINDTILAQEFGAKPGLPYGKLPRKEIRLHEYWHRMAQFYIKYMDARAQLDCTSRYWAFKDPRTTLLHSIWVDHFDVIIGMFRSPQEVVTSYLGQGWIKGLWKGRVALNYWKRFNQSLLYIYQMYKGKKPLYILDYNGDMIAQTKYLCRELGITLTESAESLFDSSLKHYTSDKFPKDQATINLYKTLKSIRIVSQ